MRWTTEKRKISDLLPMDCNPRQMTEKQNKDLERSLKKFDLVEIPAINTDNTILAGHQRLRIMAALGRGDEETDVRVPDRKLTETECKEYAVRSNKNVGQWDFEALANHFDSDALVEWGFEKAELGLLGDPEAEEAIRGAPSDEKDFMQDAVLIKIIAISAADWVEKKNKIINYLTENSVTFMVIDK